MRLACKAGRAAALTTFSRFLGSMRERASESQRELESARAIERERERERASDESRARLASGWHWLQHTADMRLACKAGRAAAWRASERLASGWRAVGERLTSGWRAAGKRLASGWRAAGIGYS